MTPPKGPGTGRGAPGPEREDDRALAAEYALGLLSAEEAVRFEQRLAHSPNLRALYAEWAEDLVALTDDIPEVPPPAAAKARLRRAIFAPPRREGWLAPRNLVRWLAGGAVAAAVLLLALDTAQVFDPAPDLRAEVTDAGGMPLLRAAFSPDLRLLRVERLAAPPPEGSDHELWLLAGQGAPVSLGVLPPGGAAVMELRPELAEQMRGAQLALSLEPAGGSPTGAPTGPVLGAGPVQEG